MLRPRPKAPPAGTEPPSHCPTPNALPLDQCLAKTRLSAEGVVLAGRSVEEHCRIVGAVAEHLLQRMPTVVRQLFPQHAERIAAVHDVGKVCPTFQEKIYRAAGCAPHSLPELQHADPALEKIWGGHAAVSMATLKACRAAPYVAEIAGQHHGFLPQDKPADFCAFGGQAWQARRCELLYILWQCESKLLRDLALMWPHIHSAIQAHITKGLTTVADWIGSGARFDDPAQPWQHLVKEAVDAAGFFPLRVRSGLSFEDIFPFAPLPAQQAFYEQVTAPGVYVLEAPMGMGKTEAALYAAYHMLQQGLSTGIYFALPTQLTSNRIHARLDAFLEKILDDTERPHAHLLHGKAWLHRFLQQEMGEDAAPHGAWFAQGKRGILAPFAAGTVDQALMAVMHVRHGAVRAYGLAGKTVILDEVHSYDAYTGVILDALVASLRQCGCTVLILSATLTAERRAILTGAPATSNAYPLVSASPAEGLCHEYPCPPLPTVVVTLQHVSEDRQAVEEALHRAEQGQQVLWIENTVVEAQEQYRTLAARTAGMDVETGLVHSRFSPADRQRNENLWTTLFGKNAPERGRKGRILVGTQVLEQSLDIDADFLVTRFCPTDMLLQRLGRLWRHSSTLRPTCAQREAYLLHPALDDVEKSPEQAWGSTSRVYMPYVLYRSLKLWEPRTTVALPCDIRPLLEATYAERVEENPAIARTLHQLEQSRRTLQGLALRGISTDANTLPEEHASTRCTQYPQVDVLLLRALNHATGTVTLADGTSLCLAPCHGQGHDMHAQQSWAHRQNIAAMLTLNMVPVPVYAAPEALSAKALHWLSPWLHCGIDPHTGLAALRVAFIRPDDSLHDLHGRSVGTHTTFYRSDFGYLTS